MQTLKSGNRINFVRAPGSEAFHSLSFLYHGLYGTVIIGVFPDSIGERVSAGRSEYQCAGKSHRSLGFSREGK